MGGAIISALCVFGPVQRLDHAVKIVESAHVHEELTIRLISELEDEPRRGSLTQHDRMVDSSATDDTDEIRTEALGMLPLGHCFVALGGRKCKNCARGLDGSIDRPLDRTPE